MTTNATAVPTLEPPLILIAEDSLTQARRLQYILEQQGYRVVAAVNGRAALECATRERPALIISDVVMPEMTGYELCRQVKQDAQLGDVPVVLVTTLSDPHDVIRGLECGADNFILKPYETDQLLRRIQLVLANDSLRHGSPRAAPPGLEIVFRGQRHCITADRLQILNLLLSTYEAAIERNNELTSTRDELRHANLELQQLTQALEERVRARTIELERSNEQLRQAQQALIQQERLRALGEMASGIAHDINNAVSPISLYTDLLLAHEKTLSESAREQLETIRRAIEDVARTVARMREFYRPNEPELQSVDIDMNVLVRQVVELTRARWSDQAQHRGLMIELRTQLDPNLPVIRGADNEVRDALTNLIFNAVDAMSGGGTLEVRTSGQEARVRLEVSDTGMGMDEETRQRCLEPFFTTKGERGTGLGLAMVYGMAQRHRAELQIDSQKGHGTTMRLLFPISEALPEAPQNPTFGRDDTPPRRLRLLVVDDDPMLSQSLRNTLQAEGHEVTVAGGGHAGIEAFQAAHRTGEPFEVVITDLGMPYVDGRQVARAIRATSANVPIIMLTGWGRNQLADTTPPPEVSRLLNKPPRLSELRAALAELSSAICAADPDPPRAATRRDPH
jgi:DNA-binding response OmpR family regulator